MQQPVNNIAFAQSESLFQEALSLYKSKQFEEAVFHFLDAAKIGGLPGGEAEYYAGHIYFEKLNDNVLAHKYLTLAYEKRHILPTKYIQFINSEITKGKQSLSFLKTELMKYEQKLASVMQQTHELEASHTEAMKSLNPETMNAQALDGAVTNARTKISQFWGNFLDLVIENVFRFDLSTQNYGITFPESFDLKERKRVEKQVCQIMPIQEAFIYLTLLKSEDCKVFGYVEKLISLNVPQEQLYHFALETHPADLTDKMANHLISKICTHLKGEQQLEISAKMGPLLKEFCHSIINMFWISKLKGFSYFITNYGEAFTKDMHENKENISYIDSNDNEDEEATGGSHVFASIIPGFIDSENKVIIKELVLTCSKL